MNFEAMYICGYFSKSWVLACGPNVTKPGVASCMPGFLSLWHLVQVFSRFFGLIVDFGWSAGRILWLSWQSAHLAA